MKNRRKFTARQRVQIVLEGLQADTSEALEELESENRRLKEVIAEITSENLDLKKTPGAWRTTPPFRGSSGR